MRSQTKNKPEVVVVTGASAGVGRAIVQAFAKRGAHIGLLARGHDGLEGARRDVEEAGGQALVITTYTADAEQVEAAAAKVEETFGPIDIWINVAMASVFSPVKEMKPEEYRHHTEFCVMAHSRIPLIPGLERIESFGKGSFYTKLGMVSTEVAYLGYIYGTLAALRRMLPRDKGRIIQIGSALAYRGIPLQSAYCGAKHAIQGFTESLRCELLHDKSNVKITMVQLPAVNTPQFGWVKNRLPHKAQPVPPIYQPEVIADGVTYVVDHYRRQLFIGLSTVIVIQANKIVPGFGDWYLGKTGFKSQQTSQPADPNAPNNLWKPVDDDKDHGAHGTFDARAKGKSWQVWADTHRGLLGLIGAGVAGVITAAVIWRSK